jgi:hypothetical protein
MSGEVAGERAVLRVVMKVAEYVAEFHDPMSENEPGHPSPAGLGDLAAEFFASLGITEERYKAMKVALDLDPMCGCADRRKWLNAMGKKLGVDNVVVRLASWLDRRKS